VGQRTYYTQLRLAPLGTAEAAELRTSLLAMDASLTPLKPFIFEKTEGTPFFIEEVVQTLAEEGVLSGERGNYQLEATPRELHISPTVQGVLAARRDQMAPDEKALLQQLSVIGRAFPMRLVQGVVSLPEDTLYRVLAALQRKEFLYEQLAFPEVEYLGLAGHQTVQRSANVEAIGRFTTALEVLQTLPDRPERNQQELGLLVALGVPLTATKSWAAPEVEKVYIRARELCEQVGDSPELFPVLWGLGTLYVAGTAHELGEQLLRLAQRRHDSALLVEAHYALGFTLFHLGEPAPARTHLEQGSALYDAQQHHSLAFSYGSFDPGVACLSIAAEDLWLLGYPEQALKSSREALSLAQELSHPFSLAFALYFAAMLHQCRREEPAVQDRAEALRVLSTEQGFPFWLGGGTIFQGWALAEQGHGAEGLSQIREGPAAWRATGAEFFRSNLLALFAEA